MSTSLSYDDWKAEAPADPFDNYRTQWTAEGWICFGAVSLWFLANDVHVRYSLSPVRLSYVVCLSVTLVHPTQAAVNFGNFSTAFGTLASVDTHRKFYGDRPRGTPPPGELKTRGVAKYSDFEPIEGYISETVQDTR